MVVIIVFGSSVSLFDESMVLHTLIDKSTNRQMGILL